MKRIVTFGLFCLLAFACVSNALTLKITIIPVNPPIVIPPPGGDFQYQINVRNLTINAQSFYVWNIVHDPVTSIDYLVYGPFGPYSVLPSGNLGPQTWTQHIDLTIPSGNLRFYSLVGATYPVWDDRSSFPFVNTAPGDGDPWISENSVTGDLNLDEALVAAPAQFALMGNYPNPFNPTTNISYSLANAGNVKLTVFDATGREVATLVNGFRDAGSHQVTFDASQLASGVYLYQLHSGSQVATGKMALMK